VTQITELARGMVASDELVVRLVEPDGHPETVIIVWPDHATVAQPARFAEIAATATGLLANASTEFDPAPECPPPSGAGPVTAARYPDITVRTFVTGRSRCGSPSSRR
jgi:hypothetical protein